MKKVLFVGEHPYGFTGNSHMMQAILAQLDEGRYKPACFVSLNSNYYQKDFFDPIPMTVIAGGSPEDPWGGRRLAGLLNTDVDIDAIVMVGVDVWAYADAMADIRKACDRKRIPWISIFPYDLSEVRKDMVKWIKHFDFPCVYSKFGEDLLKDHVPNIRHFRPPHYLGEMLHPYDPEKRMEVRRRIFSSVADDQFILGFVAKNQHRKIPHLHIKAFVEAKKAVPELVIYLHTQMQGRYNLIQHLEDFGAKAGDVLTKPENMSLSGDAMRDMFNCFDCLINCSMQEGLSWTPLEAMLCGVPVIASETTAQTELVNGAGLLVPREEMAFLSFPTEHGPGRVETRQCSVEAMRDAIIRMATDPDLRAECREKGLARGQEYLDGVSNINEVLDEATSGKIEVKSKIHAVLFVQHSSAGDVLMSTQCFKGIKERHPGMPLVYMTQARFKGIVEGNPYIDEVIEWDDRKPGEYEVVYNPHGEKILPGGWNNGDVKLADMYPYFCKVEADAMFIDEALPKYFGLSKDPPNLDDDEFTVFYQKYLAEKNAKPYETIPLKNYVVVHTTGGMAEYRTYAHMDLATKGIDLPVIQIGAKADLACRNVALDLRGKLSWRETAWVMKRARAAICVDSFPMHLAAALGVPLVALFGPAPARVTGPIGDPEKIICLEPNKLDVCPISANCWGQPGKIKCQSPCINTISPMKVRKALKSLLEKFHNLKMRRRAQHDRFDEVFERGAGRQEGDLRLPR